MRFKYGIHGIFMKVLDKKCWMFEQFGNLGDEKVIRDFPVQNVSLPRGGFSIFTEVVMIQRKGGILFRRIRNCKYVPTIAPWYLDGVPFKFVDNSPISIH